MAIERNTLIVYAERSIIVPLRITYRTARHHPLVFSLVLFLFILHTYFPSLFAFLVSNSPILACTTVLLGLLLSYGEPDLPDIEEDDTKTGHVSSLKVQATADDLFIKKDENFVIEKNSEYGSEVEEAAREESSLDKENSKFTLREEEDYIHKTGKKEDQEAETVAASLSSKDEKRMLLIEEKVDQEETSKSLEVSENSEIYIDKLNDTFELGENVCAFRIEEKKESRSIILEPPGTEQLDASLDSSWKYGDNEAFPDSESDRAESSSPDASLADIIPMLDELDPLLDLDNSQHFPVSKNDSVSEESSEDHEFNDSSDKEEAVNSCDEKDQEAQEGKEDETEAAVKWTEDDQKNVMVLGSSEMERNRRLESLIAKRRARKNLAMLMERNLIDLDFDLHVPHISAPRRNPFDPQSDPEETNDLPPIPGSAPSSMQLRKNPFDFLYDQEDEPSNFLGDSSRYLPVPQSDMFFRRNETVNFARRELVRERRRSRLKPYFVTERMDSEEGSSSSLQTQLYERSDSKVSSVAESDLVSSLADTEDNKELSDEDLHHEFELSLFSKDDIKSLVHGSQHSEGDEPVDLEIEKVEHEISDQSTHEAAEASGAEDIDLREETSCGSNILIAGTLETIEEKYDETTFSSSSETDEKSFKTTNGNELPTVSEQSMNVARSVYAESNNLRKENKVDYEQATEIVYDLSVPSTLNSESIVYDFSVPSTLNSESMNAVPSSGQASFGADISEYSLYSNMLMGVSVADLSQRPFLSSSIQAPTDGIGYPETYEMHQFANSSIEELPITKKDEGFTPVEENCFEIHDPAGVAGLQLTEELNTGSDADSDSQKPENSTSSLALSTVPLHDSSDTGLPRIEKTESVSSRGSTGYSSLSELRTELKFMSSSNLAHSSDSEPNANQDTHLIDLNSSEDELEVIRPIISEAGDIDEGILSELDAVGDFHIEDSVSDPQGAGHKLQMDSEDIDTLSLSFYVHDNCLNMRSSEDESVVYTESAINLVPEPNLDGSKEMHSAQKLPQAIDSEAGFSFQTLHSYPEQVQNLVESVSSQLLEEAMDSSALEYDIGKLITVESDEPRLTDENYGTMEQTLPDSELIILEAKSTEEILSAFKLVTEEATDSSVSTTNLDSIASEKSDLEATEADITIMTVEKTVSDSDILVLEAKSTEDILSAFEQIKEEATRSSVSYSNINQIIESCDHETREEDRDDRAMEKQMHDSELLVLEARTIEDILSASEQVKEEGVKTTVALEDQSSEDIGKEHHEPTETQSELHVIEAKSFDDIQATMKQLTDSANEQASNATADRPLELMVAERNMELEVLDAHSVEQIDLALKKAVTMETSLGEVIGQESGAEEVHDDAVSSPSASRKVQKEPKSRKSGSSSSSSSSSDSGDSE